MGLRARRSGGVPPRVEGQVPEMTAKELLDFCAEREVEICTRYDFISDSIIFKMRKKNVETTRSYRGKKQPPQVLG